MKTVLLHLLFCGVVAGQVRMVAFGRDVVSADAGAILKAVSEGYAAKHGLIPTEEELAPLRKFFGPDEAAQRRLIDFPYMVTLNWKLNCAWWGKHQGRLVLSAFGVHLATDAMLKEVVELEKTGEIQFYDLEARTKFFSVYQNYRGDGVVTGEKARKILAVSPLKTAQDGRDARR